MKARRAVDLDVPSAAPCEATLKDPRAAEPEATVKDRRAADRSFALAAASELTIRERAERPPWRASERPAQAELPIVLPVEAVELDEATVKERSAAERQVPSAASFEPTLNERSAIDPEATIKERSAAARNIPPAAPLEPTIKERHTVDRDEAIINERSAAARHVPPAAPFEPTIKERGATARRVSPPVSPTSEWPTSRPNGWLTWWLTACPNASSAPAEPPIVPLRGTSAGNARPRITRSTPTWIVLMVLIVAAAGGTVAFIYRSTNDSEHAHPSSTHAKALDDDATKTTKGDEAKPSGGDP
jgi:hypothetical protein